MITDFIKDIQKECKQGTLDYIDGEDFEAEIYKRLIKKGYKDKEDEKEDVSIKTFLDEQKDNVLNLNEIKTNPFKNEEPSFIYQPYGSQSFPDFLIFEGDTVIPLEVKSSTKGGNHPMWNGSLPRSNGLYMFVSKKDNNIKGITFFKGNLLLSESQYEKLKFYVEDIKKYTNEKLKELLKDEPNIPIVFYPRMSFNQIISCFDENQSKRENDTLNWLMTVELIDSTVLFCFDIS